ncbi:VpsF family polysaccharide biosynthesis protein [Pseudoalteromonas issachenkonii]|uniref:VpsF family polysaccharide biosynthesis protein n=1 Tax=Pseudoalteromonas issachenkonii TaxID=152297 RepID=A0ABU9GYC2_9GAMM
MGNYLYYKVVFTCVLIAFLFGGYALESMGIQYVSEGGNLLFKIHLYSYLILATFGFLLLNYKLSTIKKNLSDFFVTWFWSLLVLSFVILWGITKFGTSGLAYLIDTLLTPLLLLAIVCFLNFEQKKKLFTLIGYLFILNCLVALIEFAGKFHVFETLTGYSNYFRSSAFFSHALNNALVSIAVIPLLLNSTRFSPVFYFALSVVALFAFGGRAALAIYLLSSFVIFLPVIYRFITKGIPTSKLRFSLYIAASYFIFILLIIAIFETGIADRIIENMKMEGSANARVDVFYLLEQLSFNEWLFGASDNLRNAIDVYLGITVIENYLIGWIFTFGLIGAIPLLFSLFYPLYFFYKKGNWRTKVTILSFIVVSVSNNSLTTKTAVLFFFYLVLLLSYLINTENRFKKHNTLSDGVK